jgi:hypothetical protein
MVEYPRTDCKLVFNRCYLKKPNWGLVITILVFLMGGAATIIGYGYTADKRATNDIVKQNAAHIEMNNKLDTQQGKKIDKAANDIKWIKRSQERVEENQKKILEELKKVNSR